MDHIISSLAISVIPRRVLHVVDVCGKIKRNCVVFLYSVFQVIAKPSHVVCYILANLNRVSAMNTNASIVASVNGRVSEVTSRTIVTKNMKVLNKKISKQANGLDCNDTQAGRILIEWLLSTSDIRTIGYFPITFVCPILYNSTPST